MKILLPTLFLAVCFTSGCATKKEAAYKPVPGPSHVDPSLGNLATVTGAKVYANKEAEKKSKPAKPPKQSKQSKSDKPIVTPESGVAGKVMTYNEAGRFVVLNFPAGQMPAVDSRLFVYRSGLKVGELKVSAWQRDVYIVADLMAGEARAGDEVRNK
jgi:hypothetical protein